MNRAQLEWYLDAIEHEILQINDKDFVGNIDFKLNIKSGGISNMNIVLAKSIKQMEVLEGKTVSHLA